MIKKVQKTVPWTNVISHVKGGRVFAKENQKEFRVEKVRKRKGDKLYVK